jgi:hypothetical protein
MRDINRIEPLLNKFEELWKLNPDIRFGQMVYNLARGWDLFNIEDDKMLEIINQLLQIQKEDN